MDFEFCVLFPKVIGTYRQPGPLPYKIDVYGTRWKWLEMRGQWFWQVRVRWKDGLLWVNADREDVCLA